MKPRKPDTELDRLTAALAAAGDAPYEWDLDADRIAWFGAAADSPTQAALSGLDTGRAFNARIHPEDLVERLERIAALRDGATGFEGEFRLRGAGGEMFWFHDRGVGIYSKEGVLTGLRGALRLLARGSRATQFGYLSRHDALTGLYNRPRMREALDHALGYARRYQTEGGYLVVGIDKFSMVNQALGHDIADSVILAIGEQIDSCLRGSDIVGRVGGDSFGIILSNCPSDEITLAAERILDIARRTPIDTPNGRVYTSVSIGGISFPGAAWTATDVMTKAEIALQRAKQNGRDCFAAYVHSEGQLRDHRRKIVVAEQVQDAMREGRMRFAYQPIVDARTREPIMHECLLRIALKDGEVLPAAQFMPVVEELGMIRAIDRMAFELAMDELTRHAEARLALNVSGMTTMHQAWLRTVEARLRNQPGLARRLTVEITETTRLEDVDACAEFVAALRALGCRVALDDFGAGHTSFRHLKMLPVDIVKIDGAFVRNLEQGPDNIVFVRTLVGLAQSFGLSTVAECVETADQATLLGDEGVDYLQGYLFGRPSLESPWADATPGVGSGARAAQLASAG